MTVQVNRELIRQLRLRHSYSQEKLAEIVGVNLRTIQRIEKSGQSSLQTRAALAEAFGINPDDLDVSESGHEAAPDQPRAGRLAPAVITAAIVLLVLGVALAARIAATYFDSGAIAVGASGAIGLLLVFVCFFALTVVLDLRRWRPYFLIGIVAIGMLAGPPSLMAQTLLVLPLWLTFELSLLSARRLRLR